MHTESTALEDSYQVSVTWMRNVVVYTVNGREFGIAKSRLQLRVKHVVAKVIRMFGLLGSGLWLHRDSFNVGLVSK